ncbi:protein strawberry notch homolog 1-like isoform X2 [Mya arenaria]|uniref:protein strawberry notch homolog 1-like isoform X2 n=1 Tax=Mya arenaria TaxID=6604 RepID=UPI0022E0DC15|nr:protein strawberry notch homolog 1-like isoform X2 [Mya arenaria]
MDILSAALDESGITGEEGFDFDFSTPPSVQPSQTVPAQQTFVSTQAPLVNGQGQPVFSNALKQLAAQNDIPMPAVTTQFQQFVQQSRIVTVPSNVAPPNSPAANVIQRSASSPSVIRLPNGQLQQVVPNISAASGLSTNTPAGKKIITVKRVGPNGSITQSRSFTISADAAKGLTGSQKIIVQKSNGGTQVVRTGSPAPNVIKQTIPGHILQQTRTQVSSPSLLQTFKTEPYVKTEPDVTYIKTEPAATTSSYENQFMQFTQSRQPNNAKITVKPEPLRVDYQNILKTQPHVMQITKPLSTTVGGVVTRTLPQTGRLVSSQSVLNAGSPSIRVIQRPFQNSPGPGPPQLQHSISVPTNMSTYSNISNFPHSLLNERNTDSPPLIISRQPGLGASKMVLNNPSFVNGLPLNEPFGISSLSAMQQSVHNIASVKMTGKDLSRMWSQQDMRLKTFTTNMNSHHRTAVPGGAGSVVEEEEEGEDVEGLGKAETYNEYMPAKLKLGIKHPDPVVETSSMSSIEPPDIFYRVSIPESTIDYGELSALQLESITYASQRHSITLPSGEKAGFLIGDGAGVGKGRTLAGIIFENYLLGRKRAIWLSVSNDLRVDAERDLRDIGASKIDVHALNKFKYAKISGKENGSVKKGVIFATYSSLIGESHSTGKYRTRFKQLIKWCGKDFDGVIVFDECHKAKNLCPVGSSKPTKTGQTVLELQKRLPMARVVYASATGASEPKNMAYMTRLGLWGPGTPFPEFNDFIQAVEKRGVGAMELVAMDMKLRGMYIARQLSFKGVTFKIEEIPIDKEFMKMYNEAVQLWQDAREMFQEAADLVGAQHKLRKSMWGQFWSAHQRFFKYLCISAKVPHCVRLAREAIRDGKCVVIGLQSTGEARTLEQLEEMGGELNDFVSTAKGVVQTVIEKHFPAPDQRKFFDAFGLGNNVYNNEDSNSSTNGLKRKRESLVGNQAKKSKGESESDSSSDSEESDFDLGLSDTSDDDDDDDESDDNDNFNPFGNGSDSDEDPWLKKANKKAKVKQIKKEKKKKEKKKKEKKEKKKSKNEDEEFTSQLAAAGLLKGGSNSGADGPGNTGGDSIEKAFQMKRELLERVELLGDRLPANTLDQLIDDLGGVDNVAEMTGRKGRVVCTDEGISYESRSENDVPLEILNLTEKQRFMDGEKNIAIISEAASSGISLQADRRVINQRRRVHITLELPWSADRAIQQFGRTHRSNQVSAPEYMFLISELAGEQRFASTVAKRLESLGALTHGDRRATESRDLSRFNFDNKYGKLALESVMKTVCGFESRFVNLPVYELGNFFEDCQQAFVGVGMITKESRDAIPMLDKDYNNISKFLNRLLGVEVTLQNALFKYFSSTLTTVILEAKKSGRWDMGIMDLGSGGESVKKLETKVFVGNTATNTAKTELVTVSVERGMSFPSAFDIWKKYTGVNDGFYISLQDRSIRRFAIVAAYQGSYNKKKEKLFTVYRPNTGLQPKQETLEEIKKKYKKVLPEEAQRYWEEQYNMSANTCSHAYWRGQCKKISLGLPCEVGLRTRTYYVLSGSVLSVWNKVESVLASLPSTMQTKMQIIRLRTDDNQRIVGSLIPSNAVQPLSNVLGQSCSKTYTEKHSGSAKPTLKEEAAASDNIDAPPSQQHSTPQTPQAVYSMPVFV